MKKTFAWFEAQGIDYVFHDYKKEGVPQAHLLRWCGTPGWQTLLNTRGTTWRKLSAGQQAITSTDQAVALMQASPSVIRRPLIEVVGELQSGELLIGFDPQRWATLFRQTTEPQA